MMPRFVNRSKFGTLHVIVIRLESKSVSAFNWASGTILTASVGGLKVFQKGIPEGVTISPKPKNNFRHARNMVNILAVFIGEC
jgi:hypothetical protein